MPSLGVARDRTLGDLRRASMKRADRPNALKRFPEDEVNDMVNAAIADFYDLLVVARGAPFFALLADPMVTSPSTITYRMPEDFLQLLSVRLDANGVQRVLEPFEELEEAELRNVTTAGYFSLTPAYRLRGDAGGRYLDLLPAPPTGTLNVRYLPAAPILNGEDDTFNGFNIGVAHEYVIAETARQIATIEGEWELVAALNSDLARYKQRIQGLATKHDAGRPPRVKDVRGLRYAFGRRF